MESMDPLYSGYDPQENLNVYPCQLRNLANKMKTFDQLRFSLAIKQNMLAASHSTRSAAKAIGTSPATLNRLINCKFLPDVNTCFAVCKWLGRDMEFFFTNKKKL